MWRRVGRRVRSTTIPIPQYNTLVNSWRLATSNPRPQRGGGGMGGVATWDCRDWYSGFVLFASMYLTSSTLLQVPHFKYRTSSTLLQAPYLTIFILTAIPGKPNAVIQLKPGKLITKYLIYRHLDNKRFKSIKKWMWRIQIDQRVNV